MENIHSKMSSGKVHYRHLQKITMREWEECHSTDKERICLTIKYVQTNVKTTIYVQSNRVD